MRHMLNNEIERSAERTCSQHAHYVCMDTDALHQFNLLHEIHTVHVVRIICNSQQRKCDEMPRGEHSYCPRYTQKVSNTKENFQVHGRVLNIHCCLLIVSRCLLNLFEFSWEIIILEPRHFQITIYCKMLGNTRIFANYIAK